MLLLVRGGKPIALTLPACAVKSSSPLAVCAIDVCGLTAYVLKRSEGLNCVDFLMEKSAGDLSLLLIMISAILAEV